MTWLGLGKRKMTSNEAVFKDTGSFSCSAPSLMCASDLIPPAHKVAALSQGVTSVFYTKRKGGAKAKSLSETVAFLFKKEEALPRKSDLHFIAHLCTTEQLQQQPGEAGRQRGRQGR